MKAKQVAWSYPSSPNAEKFGFGGKGCYTVSTIIISPMRLPGEAVAAFATLQAAKDFAAKMPEPWDKYTL